MADPRYQELLAVVDSLERLTGNRYQSAELLRYAENLDDEELHERVCRARALWFALLRKQIAPPQKRSRRSFAKDIAGAFTLAILAEATIKEIEHELGISTPDAISITELFRKFLG